MGVKTIIATLFLLFGIAFLVVGIGQIEKSRNPKICVVSFAKSLGGKASFELGQLVKKDRLFGIAGISVGVVFTLVGGIFLYKSKK